MIDRPPPRQQNQLKKIRYQRISYGPMLLLFCAWLTFYSVFAQPERVQDPLSGLSYEAAERSAGSYQLSEPATAGTNRSIRQHPLQNGGPLSPFDIGITFPGPDFDDNSAQIGVRFIPPDPMGAAGIDRVLGVVNVLIEMRDKSGSLIFQEDLKTFFSPLGGQTLGTYTFDPKVVFDPYEERFVVVTMEQTESPQGSRILMAVSKTATPSTAGAADWYFLSINSLISINGVPAWADYPGFELDEEAIYVTANMFPFAAGDVAVRLWIIDKGVSGGFYSGGSASVTIHDPYAGGGVPVTTMPAQVYGAGGVPGGSGDVGTFLVGYDGLSDGSSEFVQIVRVDDPLGSAGGPFFTLETIDVGNIDNTGASVGTAPQPGATSFLDMLNTVGRRVYDAVWRDGALWLVTIVNPPDGPDAGQTTVHWFKVNTSAAPGGALTLADQGDIGGETLGPETYTFFPSVAVNSAGDAQFGFGASSYTLYGGAYTAGRAALDPAGSTRPAETVAEGLDFYVRTFGGFRNRWGDYSGISIDPADDSQFWIFNLYAGLRGSPTGNEDGRWETMWANATLPDLVQEPDILVTPQAIDYGTAFVGDSVVKSIYIDNNGGNALTVSTISAPAAPLYLDLSSLSNGGTLPITIPSLGRERIKVIYNPLMAGSSNDVVNISSDDPDQPSITVTLQGEAITPVSTIRETIYATAYVGADQRLMVIDQNTGQYSSVVLDNFISTLGINLNGELFGSVNGDLYRIDPSSGVSTFVSSTGLTDGLNGIDFLSNELMYAITLEFLPPSTLVNHFYSIDPATGAATLIGDILNKNLFDIAVNPLDGSIWASGGDSGGDLDYIYTIDPATAAITEVGKVGIVPGPGFIPIIAGLQFDYQGRLFGAFSNGNINTQFLSIGLNPLNATVITAYPYNELSALSAFAAYKAPLAGAHIGLSPSALDFGAVAVGWKSDTALITVRSIGTDPLTITGITASGAPFELITDSLSGGGALPIIMPPGSSERFQVVFAPQDSGLFAGSITLSSDDPDDPQMVLSLSGEGSEVMAGGAYAVIGQGNGATSGELLRMNIANGSGASLGNSGLNGISALAISTAGEMVVAESGNGALYRLNHLTAETLPVGMTSLPAISALAFDGRDSLYAISLEAPDYPLYQINPHTGAATLIGPTGDFFTSLAFDPTDGTLWAATSNSATTPDGVFRIDPGSGAATLVGQTGLSGLGSTEGLMFDQAGNLYGAKALSGPPSLFISIDKATGAGTNKGTIGFKGVNGLAARLDRNLLVGIEGEIRPEVPAAFALAQNYPNPFNPTTEIPYALPVNARVEIAVYNILGQKVRTLVNHAQSPGYYTARWDGRNDAGQLVGSGIYIYRISAGSYTAMRKMILLK
ncbi:MAG: choice-of-anchor D domain-containing protein [Calditrichae bacterium]|nr:choice-of-anchor D domain-containing protein [Calditrichia bacterium]